MSAGKSLLFVYPRMRYPSGDFSLGIAGLSAYLKREIPDLSVSLLDTTFHRSFSRLERGIARSRPDIVGIYVDTTMYADAVRAAGIARSLGCHVVAGGPHATVLPESLLEHPSFDAVMVGEAERSLRDYVAHFYGDRSFGEVRGIALRRDGAMALTPPWEAPLELDALPDPDLELFDLERYIRHFIQLDSFDPRLRGLSMIISRGCPFRCSFCQPTLEKLFGRRPRILSAPRVAALIGSYVERYRVGAIYFQDDTLTFFRDWMEEFCALMERARLPVVWACNTRADTVDRALLGRMKSAGCVKIKVGVEAFSDRIRNGCYRKEVSLAQVDSLIGWCRGLRMQVAGFFMLGAPTETEEEVRRTIDYAVSSDLIEANFSVTTPLPGTLLHRMARESGWALPAGFPDYDYYQVGHRRSAPGQIDYRRLARLKKCANLRFYLRPRRLPSVVKSFISLRGLRKVAGKLRRI